MSTRSCCCVPILLCTLAALSSSSSSSSTRSDWGGDLGTRQDGELEAWVSSDSTNARGGRGGRGGGGGGGGGGGLRLVQMIAITRHGDRTPRRSFARNPVDWPEGLGQLTQRGKQQTRALGRALAARFASRATEPLSPRPGEVYLRASGLDRTIMSANYISLGLFGGEGREDEAGEAVGEAFGEAFGEEGSPSREYSSPLLLPVHSVDEINEIVHRAKDLCPLYDRRLTGWFESEEWRGKEKTSQRLVQRLRDATGEAWPNLKTFYDTADTLKVLRLHSKLVLNISQTDLRRAEALGDWAEYNALSSRVLGGLGATPLLLEALQLMQRHARAGQAEAGAEAAGAEANCERGTGSAGCGEEAEEEGVSLRAELREMKRRFRVAESGLSSQHKYRLALYSGHDCTLLSVLAAFQMDRQGGNRRWLQRIPPYAAAITIELYEPTPTAAGEGQRGLYVLINYRKNAKEGFVPLPIPGCPSPREPPKEGWHWREGLEEAEAASMCAWDDFEDLVRKEVLEGGGTLEGWCKLCGNDISEGCLRSTNVQVANLT